VEVGKDARVAGVAGLGRVLGDVVIPSLWMSSVRVGGA